MSFWSPSYDDVGYTRVIGHDQVSTFSAQVDGEYVSERGDSLPANQYKPTVTVCIVQSPAAPRSFVKDLQDSLNVL